MVNEIKYVSNVKGIHPVFTGGYFSVIVALGDLDLNISKFHANQIPSTHGNHLKCVFPISFPKMHLSLGRLAAWFGLQGVFCVTGTVTHNDN